jgi:hypothetical protein
MASDYISLPAARIESRVLEGIYIPDFHRFLAVSKKPVTPDLADSEVKVKNSDRFLKTN